MSQVSTAPKAKAKPNINFLREDHEKPVRGIFKFHEVPGGVMEFVFKEFKGQKIEKYTLADGEIYTIPKGVAIHLNKNGWFPLYNFVQGDGSVQTGMAVQGFSNNSVQKVTKKERRFSFNSLEFMDIDDMPDASSKIITIESV
jgi:hypothetical protein